MSAEQRSYRNPDIRFFAGFSEVMSRDDAEAQLAGLIEHVLERLLARGVAHTSAALRWARVKRSREDPDEAAFCEAAGALRLDPYDIAERDAASIAEAATLFTDEPLTEFLAGARTVDRVNLIQWARTVRRRAGDQSRLVGLQQAATASAERSPRRDGEAAWAIGYRRARTLRHVLGFDQTRRFLTFTQLAGAVGAGRAYSPGPRAYGIRLLRDNVGDDAHLHMRAHGDTPEAQASHLFTLARGIGDVACFPDPGTAPVNDLRSAYRQAAGRAFAAEFLAPVDEVLSMRNDGWDEPAIAEVFAVAADVVERQIENADRIALACR